MGIVKSIVTCVLVILSINSDHFVQSNVILSTLNAFSSTWTIKSHNRLKIQSSSSESKMAVSADRDSFGAIGTPKNLKLAPGQGTNSVASTWKELSGLSEKDLIVGAGNFQDRKDIALSLAYRRCEYLTKLYSKTFYMGTSLMHPDARKHVWAIYAWCRRTDDLVDSPRACLLNRENLEVDLKEWTERLDKIWKGEPIDLFDLAMADTVKKYPDMSIEPYRDMVKGMVMDVPGLGQERYKNFDELYLYCYRVAGTVGLMTMPMLGTADGYTFEDATEPGVALGIGFQLTNILRDVGEDLERGRIYLPQDEIAAFGLTEEDLFRCDVSPKYKEFMKFQIQRARDYYTIAKTGVPMLAPEGRFAVQASLDLYSRILDVIERNDYDNFRCRAYTSKWEKLTILPGAWWAAQNSGAKR